MNKEIRMFTFDVRAERDEQHGNIITGVPIVFDSRTDMGRYDEIIERGALNKTDMRDVRFLVNHNIEMIPLARSRNNNANSTMQMWVEEDGTHIRVDLDTENNTTARSLYSAVDRGDIDGMSFMFIVDQDDWENLDTDHPTRRIRSISKIFEVSAVTFPAYKATSITARGLSDALDSALESLESAKAKYEAIERQKQRIRILTEVSK